MKFGKDLQNKVFMKKVAEKKSTTNNVLSERKIQTRWFINQVRVGKLSISITILVIIHTPEDQVLPLLALRT